MMLWLMMLLTSGRFDDVSLFIGRLVRRLDGNVDHDALYHVGDPRRLGGVGGGGGGSGAGGFGGFGGWRPRKGGNRTGGLRWRR